LVLKLSNQDGHRHPKAENFRPARTENTLEIPHHGLGPA
jgi:hypothetical protein